MKTNIEVNKEFDIFYISFLKNMEEVKGDR